jgi:hypothetical protein
VPKPQLLGRALLGAVDLFNRNPWTENGLALLPREPRALYAEDGLVTHHGHRFVEGPAFQRAYARAIEAAGFDYAVRWRTHTLLWAATRGAGLAGAFVECGTGRGFMASAICSFLDWGERPFYLYDTFLSTYPDSDGTQAGQGTICPHYADGPEQVRRNFAEWPGVELVVGTVPGTLLETAPVAFLHIDMNNARAEEAAVRHFWPRLAPGAPMVFDDYGFAGYEAQREGADELADELGFSILSLPTGQGLVIR